MTTGRDVAAANSSAVVLAAQQLAQDAGDRGMSCAQAAGARRRRALGQALQRSRTASGHLPANSAAEGIEPPGREGLTELDD
jgi:hypothetical protein